MNSGTKYFFMFWSDKDVYSNSTLKTDIGKIEDYYFNRGYIRFRILSNQVNLSNNNKDIIMGIEHKERPIYGVQFHPESIDTENGKKLINNFITMT